MDVPFESVYSSSLSFILLVSVIHALLVFSFNCRNIGFFLCVCVFGRPPPGGWGGGGVLDHSNYFVIISYELDADGNQK